MSTATPFSLRIFIAAGDLDGLRLVERSNWIGKAVVFPRALLPSIKKRLGWERAGGRLQLGDTFEPYEQTRLEMTWAESAVEEISRKTSGKTSGKILDGIRENAEITIPELSARIGVTEGSIERNIKILQEAGRLRRIGPAKGGHWEVLDAD